MIMQMEIIKRIVETHNYNDAFFADETGYEVLLFYKKTSSKKSPIFAAVFGINKLTDMIAVGCVSGLGADIAVEVHDGILLEDFSGKILADLEKSLLDSITKTLNDINADAVTDICLYTNVDQIIDEFKNAF